MDETEMASILLNRFAYLPNEVDSVVKDLLALPSHWLAGFQSYLETGVVPVLPTFDGISVTSLMEQERFLAPAAFLTMAWLEADPAAHVKILRRGYDTIIMEG